jgi:hypothetical protein
VRQKLPGRIGTTDFGIHANRLADSCLDILGRTSAGEGDQPCAHVRPTASDVITAKE